jgi:DNA-binding transcriptional regulator YdaS (Cro superfamily)
MEKLLTFLKQIKVKPTPWAVKHGISPAVMSRLLSGKRISASNYLKVATAAKGKVTVEELMVEH